jgi:FtsZ-binding cell division protein ZapB
MAEQVHMTINNNEALEIRLAVAEDTVDKLRHEIEKLKVEVNTLERALKIISRGEDSRW